MFYTTAFYANLITQRITEILEGPECTAISRGSRGVKIVAFYADKNSSFAINVIKRQKIKYLLLCCVRSQSFLKLSFSFINGRGQLYIIQI